MSIEEDDDDTLTISSTVRKFTLTTNKKQKARLLQIQFMLPENQYLLEDYHCALAKTILHQGKLSVFTNYVCFYSNILGYVKQKVIPVEKIRSLTKKKNYGFPNSIEIIWNDEENQEPNKAEFFTSFLSRDDAYNVIYQCLHQNLQDNSGKMLFKPRKLRTSWSDSEIQGCESTSQQVLKRSKTELPLRLVGQIGDIDSKQVSSQGSDGDNEDDDDDDDDDREDDSNQYYVNSNNAWGYCRSVVPDRLENMQLLMESSLEVNTQDFANLFLANNATLFKKFHQSRGDSRIHISPWRVVQGMGHVRDVVFSTALKYRIGPSETACSQVQRVAFYYERQQQQLQDHLIFETSQVMPNIPFGDAFKIETRWDIVNVRKNACKITIYCGVPFSKKVYFKQFIKGNAIKELKQNQVLLLKLMKEELRSALPKQVDEVAYPKYFSTDVESVCEVPNSPKSVEKIQNQQVQSYTFWFQQYQKYGNLIMVVILVLMFLYVVWLYSPRQQQQASTEYLRELVIMYQKEILLLKKRIALMEKQFQEINRLLDTEVYGKESS